jgi:hypothetical protein
MGTGSFLEVKQPESGVENGCLTAVSFPPLSTYEIMLWDDIHLLTFGKFWSIRSVSTAADSNHAFVPSSRLLSSDRLQFTYQNKRHNDKQLYTREVVVFYPLLTY